jgi:hypothetical protein
VAQAGAEARPRQQRAPTLGRAVAAVGEGPLDAGRRLLRDCRALERLLGLGKGRGPGILGVPEMPEHPPLDHRGQIPLLPETGAWCLIRQDRDGQWPPTPGQHGAHTLLTQGTDQTGERHGRARADHRPEFQTEPARRGQEGIAGALEPPLALAPDDMGPDGAHRMTRRARETPDGDPTQAHAEIRRVVRQASATAPSGLVGELKAEGPDEGEPAFAKRLAIAKQLNVGGCILESNGEGCGCRESGA